jgi:hypothetical protein
MGRDRLGISVIGSRVFIYHILFPAGSFVFLQGSLWLPTSTFSFPYKCATHACTKQSPSGYADSNGKRSQVNNTGHLLLCPMVHCEVGMSITHT